MPANTTQGFPYPLPSEPVAEGAQAIRNLAEAIKTAQCIGEIDLTTAQSFSGISQAFDHLRLVVVARSTGATKADSMYLRLNGVTSAAYFVSNIQLNNGAQTVSQLLSQTQWVFGVAPGTSASANYFGSGDILLPNYAGTQPKFAQWLAHAHTPQATNASDLWTLTGSGSIASGPAITSLTLGLMTGGATGFVAGSRAWLYGISGA